MHNYGRADVGASYINEARERGIDVWAAQHPYTATQSNLLPYSIPDWAAADGHEEMVRRFDDVTLSERIADATNEMLRIRGSADKIVFLDPHPELSGRTLSEIAAGRELTPADAAQQILRDGDPSVMNLELYDHANTPRPVIRTGMIKERTGVLRSYRVSPPVDHRGVDSIRWRSAKSRNCSQS